MAEQSTIAAENANVAHDPDLGSAEDLENHPFSNEDMPQEGIEAIESHPGDAVHGVDPTVLGMNATAWVSLAMIVLIVLALWKKVPQVMGRSLDEKIAAIRAQLAEAEAVRKEAEELRASYTKKLNDAEGEAASIRKAAEEEAAQLVEKTRADSEALIARRQKMAEEKISAAERAAIADLRSKAAAAAATAAQALIAEKHDAASDAKLVDAAIGKLN